MELETKASEALPSSAEDGDDLKKTARDLEKAPLLMDSSRPPPSPHWWRFHEFVAAEGERAALRAVTHLRSVENRALEALSHVRRVIDDEVERLRSLRLARDDVDANRRGLRFLETKETTLEAAARVVRWLKHEAEQLATFSDDSFEEASDGDDDSDDDDEEGDVRRDDDGDDRNAPQDQNAKAGGVEEFLAAEPPRSDVGRRALCETEKVLWRVYAFVGDAVALARGSSTCRSFRDHLDRRRRGRAVWKWTLRFAAIPGTGTRACKGFWLALAEDANHAQVFSNASFDDLEEAILDPFFASFDFEENGDGDDDDDDDDDDASEKKKKTPQQDSSQSSSSSQQIRRLASPLSIFYSQKDATRDERPWAAAIAVDAARTPIRRLWRGIALPRSKHKGDHEDDDKDDDGDSSQPSFDLASNEEMAPHRQLIAEVLERVAKRYPKLGYCQGLDYVAAFALRGARLDPDAAFTTVRALLDHLELASLFEPGLPGLKGRCRELRLLLDARCPLVSRRLRDHRLHLDLFAAAWLQTLFVYVDALPLAVLDRVWTVLLFERSFKVVHRLALALFVTVQDRLVRTCRAPHDTLLFLSRLTSAESARQRKKKHPRPPGPPAAAAAKETRQDLVIADACDVLVDDDDGMDHLLSPEEEEEVYDDDDDDAAKRGRRKRAKNPLGGKEESPQEAFEEEDHQSTPDLDDDTTEDDDDIPLFPSSDDLLRLAMNIKVTNSMLNRINHNAILPRPLRSPGTSDPPNGAGGLTTMAGY